MTDELMLPGHPRTFRETGAVADLDLSGFGADFGRGSAWRDVARAYRDIARAVGDCAKRGNALARALDTRFQSRPEGLRLAGDAGAPAVWTPAPERSAAVDLARRAIGAALDARLDDPTLDEDLIVALAEAVLDFLLRAQMALRLAGDGRRDAGAHDIGQEVARRRLSGLLDELEACFGLAIGLDADSLEVMPKPLTEPRLASAQGA